MNLNGDINEVDIEKLNLDNLNSSDELDSNSTNTSCSVNSIQFIER